MNICNPGIFFLFGFPDHVKYPENWNWKHMKADTVVGVPLDLKSEEAVKVSQMFLNSGLQAIVVRIVRIQNSQLWGRYYRRRQQMEEHGDRKVEELQLFHGTSPFHIDDICREGFDVEMAVDNSVFGRGIYFAKEGKYADWFATTSTFFADPKILTTALNTEQFEDFLPSPEETSQSENSPPDIVLSHIRQYVLLCSVLVGSTTQGHRGYTMPPLINPDDPNDSDRRYDSCFAGEDEMLQYVVFRSDQTYPEYLIEYMSNVRDFSPENIGSVWGLVSLSIALALPFFSLIVEYLVCR